MHWGFIYTFIQNSFSNFLLLSIIFPERTRPSMLSRMKSGQKVENRMILKCRCCTKMMNVNFLVPGPAHKNSGTHQWFYSSHLGLHFTFCHIENSPNKIKYLFNFSWGGIRAYFKTMESVSYGYGRLHVYCKKWSTTSC